MKTFYNKSINKENTSIINIYVPNNRAPKYMKQKLTEVRAKVDNSTIIVGNLNTQLSIVDRATRQKSHKDIGDLNNTVNQLHNRHIDHTTHQQQNTQSSQMHKEHSPGEVI